MSKNKKDTAKCGVLLFFLHIISAYKSFYCIYFCVLYADTRKVYAVNFRKNELVSKTNQLKKIMEDFTKILQKKK